MKNNKGIWIAAIVVCLIMVSVVAISIKKYLKVLDQMKKDGYLKDDETGEITYLNNLGLNNEEILQNIKSGNFIVALSSGEIDENFKKDNIAVKTVEHYLTSRVNASIGIAKNTEDVDAVVEFLGLLYVETSGRNISNDT